MPAVNVQPSVFSCPALGAAARALNMSRSGLCFGLLQVWSRVTEQGHATMRSAIVAAALGKRVEAVSAALVASELAVSMDDGALDLEPMRSLFGDYEWYTELRESAPAGGRARAESGERDPVTGQMLRRDYRAQIRLLLAGGAVRSRAAFARMLKADRTRVGAALDQLVESGEVHETEDGFALAVVSELPHGSPDDTPAVSRLASPLTTALTPALAQKTEHMKRDPHDIHTPGDDNSSAPGDMQHGLPHGTNDMSPDDSEAGRTTAQTTIGDDRSMQGILNGYEASDKQRYEKAANDGFGRELVNWLNALHRTNGRNLGHKGFQYDSDDVQDAVKRFRHKLKLKPEEVIAVCERRVAVWRSIPGCNWLDNCRPATLFAPKKFSEALSEHRANLPLATASAPLRRGERPGVATAPNEHYRDLGIGECEI